MEKQGCLCGDLGITSEHDFEQRIPNQIWMDWQTERQVHSYWHKLIVHSKKSSG